MLTADDIKRVSALAAQQSAERTELKCRQGNEREEMELRHEAERNALGIGRPAGAPPPATAEAPRPANALERQALKGKRGR